MRLHPLTSKFASRPSRRWWICYREHRSRSGDLLTCLIRTCSFVNTAPPLSQQVISCFAHYMVFALLHRAYKKSGSRLPLDRSSLQLFVTLFSFVVQGFVSLCNDSGLQNLCSAFSLVTEFALLRLVCRNPFLTFLPSLLNDLTFVEAVIRNGCQDVRGRPQAPGHTQRSACLPPLVLIPFACCVFQQRRARTFASFNPKLWVLFSSTIFCSHVKPLACFTAVKRKFFPLLFSLLSGLQFSP